MPDFPTPNVSTSVVDKFKNPLRLVIPPIDFRNVVGNPGSQSPHDSNDALYFPFVVHEEVTITQVHLRVGITSAGNVDVGLYDSSGNRLTSTGSTAAGSINSKQTFNIADQTLAPGIYYLAVACDDGTMTFYCDGGFMLGNAEWADMYGVREEASAFPLPATATFGTPASVYFPIATLETNQ